MKTTALTFILLSATCAIAQDSPPETPPPVETTVPVVVPATIEELEGAARDATNGVAVVAQALLELSQRAGLGRYYFVRIKELFDQDQPEADVEARHLFRFLARVQNDEVVMAVAEFLTQNTRRPRKAADPDFVAPEVIAAETLGQMDLPDAPIDKPVAQYTPEDVVTWRTWLEQFE